MGRTLVIGDIHGGFLAIQQLFERAAVTKEDTLIFLGDYVDGWSQSVEVIDFLIELSTKQKTIFLRGNHDQIVLDWLLGNTENFNEKMWFIHGGEATQKSYETVSLQKKEKHIQFLQSLKDYYLDTSNRLFIHAGYTNMAGIENEYFEEMFYWDRTLWELVLCLDPNMPKEHPHYPKRLLLYPEIYIGHTPVTKIGETTPINKACVWNIDTGAAFKGSLSILDVDTKDFWQSDPLPQIYPYEKGRN